MNVAKCKLCGNTDSMLVSAISMRPEMETDYGIEAGSYYREIRRCLSCQVYFNEYGFTLITNEFYSGFYNGAIETKLLDRFDRITGLPFEASDNKQRAARVASYVRDYFDNNGDVSLLDVGTGTGVFVFEISKFIPDVSCVDPDPSSIELVKLKAKPRNAWVGSLEQVPTNHVFRVVTYNKVLEHVEDPIRLLKSTRGYLADNGLIYVELPYATELIKANLQDERSEFFIEHFTTYTAEALEYLIHESGFRSVKVDVLVEPSGKHTIYAFASKQDVSGGS